MNVVFMGTPEFACPPMEALVASPHRLTAVVTAPDKPAGRGHKLTACRAKLKASDLKVPVFQPAKLNNPEFLENMRELHPDVFVVIAFRILPQKLFKIPRYGAINIHASLLPEYRGAAPIQHALLNGETETGLTSFFLARKVDEGDIIHQVKTEIDENENYYSLATRLSEMAGPFLLETLDKIQQPDFVPSRQDDALATPAPKIYPEDGRIDWRQPKRAVHNRIRAFSERPGAFGFLGSTKIKVLASKVDDEASLAAPAPGELVVAQKRLFVGTGTDPLRLTCLQPEGKAAMDDDAFINGYLTGKEHTLNNVPKGGE